MLTLVTILEVCREAGGAKIIGDKLRCYGIMVKGKHSNLVRNKEVKFFNWRRGL